MNIGNELFFAPGFSFAKLRDFSDKPEVLKAFKARVLHLYLTPAHHLAECKDAFACGLVCSATIDFLGRYSYPNKSPTERIPKWLIDNIGDVFSGTDYSGHTDRRGKLYATLAERFSDEFRNGLVHEGRIKSLGQFSLGAKYRGGIVHFVDKGKYQAMLINPQQLLEAIHAAFDMYYHELRSNNKKRDALVDVLKKDFKEEIGADRKKRLAK